MALINLGDMKPQQNRPPAQPGVTHGPPPNLDATPQPAGTNPAPNLPTGVEGIPASAGPALSDMGMTAGSTEQTPAGDATNIGRGEGATGGFPGPSGDSPRTKGAQGTVIGQTKARPRTPFLPSQFGGK